MTSNSRINQFYDAINSLSELEPKHKIQATKQNVESFKVLFSTVKWNNEIQIKIMAAGYIPKYIGFFDPEVQELGINAQLDLCEDDDIKVRKEAIKNLPLFTKGAPKYASRIADVLLQLLQFDDPQEVAIVADSLIFSFQNFAKSSTDALFHQCQHGVPAVRNQAFSFLATRLLPILAPTMKLKLLKRFFTILEGDSTQFSSNELDIILSLVSQIQAPVLSPFYPQLELLYKKRLECLLQTPEDITYPKLNKVIDLYKTLFIWGASSFRLVCLLSSQFLNRSVVSTLTAGDQLNLLKTICDITGFISELWSLGDIIPLFENMLKELSLELTKEDNQIKLGTMKIEPIAYFLLFCRQKCPNVAKTNSADFQKTLKKLLDISKAISERAKSTASLVNDATANERSKKILASTLSASLFIEELLQGEKAKGTLKMITSWNQKINEVELGPASQKIVGKSIKLTKKPTIKDVVSLKSPKKLAENRLKSLVEKTKSKVDKAPRKSNVNGSSSLAKKSNVKGAQEKASNSTKRPTVKGALEKPISVSFAKKPVLIKERDKKVSICREFVARAAEPINIQTEIVPKINILQTRGRNLSKIHLVEKQQPILHLGLKRNALDNGLVPINRKVTILQTTKSEGAKVVKKRKGKKGKV